MDSMPSTRQLVERLCSFDTTSRQSNLELIDFVADLLNGHDLRCSVIHDPTGTKANLIATIGPDCAGGVVLSGHTDVVPTDGQRWSSDPFRVVERDGVLVGRGVADMKGFIASVLAAVPHLRAARLQVPIHLVLSYDEEVGCLGVHSALEHIEAAGLRPRAAIIGEPTGMAVVDAHKSCSRLTISLTGAEAHSSDPRNGINAIFFAARVVRFLEELAAEYAAKEFDPRFSPPGTTISVGQINGGIAPNIIPRQANLVWEIRALSEQHKADILARVESFLRTTIEPQMSVAHADTGVTTQLHSRGVGLTARQDCPARALACLLAGTNESHAVSYGTEAGLFQQHGIPAVLCGPGHIEQAHKADEWIALSQLDSCDRFLRRLLVHLSGDVVVPRQQRLRGAA